MNTSEDLGVENRKQVSKLSLIGPSDSGGARKIPRNAVQPLVSDQLGSGDREGDCKGV